MSVLDTYRKNAAITIVIHNSPLYLPKGWTLEMRYSNNNISVLNRLVVYAKKPFLMPVLTIELRDITSIFIEDIRIYSNYGHSYNDFVDNKLCLDYAQEIIDDWERHCFPEGKEEHARKFLECIYAGEEHV